MAINTQAHTTTASTVAARPAAGRGTNARRTEVRLWATQGAMAALFLFAGSGKLFGSSAAIEETSDFPVLFLRFIGLCEVLGAIGLILPWALGIKRGLTPLAAAGLAVIMVGATITVALTMSPALALVDLAFAAGLLAIVRGRSSYATRSR